jgi:hypothetical protein
MKTCTIPGCDQAIRTRGMCSTHWYHNKRYGDPLFCPPEKPTSCLVAGCGKPVEGHGYCAPHRRRWYKYGDPLAGKTVAGAPRAFLDAAVVSQTDECIVWPFTKGEKGYAQIGGGQTKERRQVHRIICERVHGPAPSPQHFAAHAPVICHTRACINPRHIRWATPSENMFDRCVDGTMPHGEAHPHAALTERQALAVLADPRGVRAIANEYGVSHSTISNIRRGVTWKHLPRHGGAK